MYFMNVAVKTHEQMARQKTEEAMSISKNQKAPPSGFSYPTVGRVDYSYIICGIYKKSIYIGVKGQKNLDLKECELLHASRQFGVHRTELHDIIKTIQKIVTMCEKETFSWKLWKN